MDIIKFSLVLFISRFLRLITSQMHAIAMKLMKKFRLLASLFLLKDRMYRAAPVNLLLFFAWIVWSFLLLRIH